MALGLLLLQARASLIQTQEKVAYTLDNVNRVVRLTGGTVANLRHATAEWEAASAEQRKYWAAASKRAERVLAEAEGAIGDFRRVTLPQLAASMGNADAQITRVSGEVSHAVRDLQPVLENLEAASHHAAERMGDPNIAATLESVRNSAEHVEVTTGHLELASAHIEKKVEQMTRPAHWTKQVGLFLLQVAGSVGSFFAGIVK